MLKVGKLYSCSDYYLMLYPDRKSIFIATEHVVRVSVSASFRVLSQADYWSVTLGKPVRFCKPKTLFLVLNTDSECVEVLVGNKKGWIVFRDWLNIKKVRK